MSNRQIITNLSVGMPRSTECLAYTTLEIISAVLMKENTVNYPDIANCFQRRRLHRSRRAVSVDIHLRPRYTPRAQHDPRPRMIATAPSVHTTSRICAAGNSWIERSNQYTSIIWFSFAAAASLGLSHLSSFSRIYDSHPSTESLFRCQLFFVRHHETSVAQRGRRNEET